MNRSTTPPEETGLPEAVREQPAGDGARQFITFVLGEESFAVPMDVVQEIIRMPALVHVPMSPGAFMGVANLRGRVLPIVSLRRLAGLPDTTADEATRVIVLKGALHFGLVVDRVSRALSVTADQIESSGDFRSAFDTECLEGVIKVDDRAIVQVLDFAYLIEGQLGCGSREEAVGGRGVTAAAASEDPDEEGGEEEWQLITFTVAEQEYALPLGRVREIVHVPEHISSVPRSDTHVLGLMTLRDRTLPLVSLRQIFGLPPLAPSPEQRVIVVPTREGAGGRGGSSVGIVTDSVSEVLRVPVSRVEPMPELLREEAAGMAEISALCRPEGEDRLVSIIGVDRLFEHRTMRAAAEHPALESEEGDVNEPERNGDVQDEEQFVIFRLADEEYGIPISAVKEIVRMPDQLTAVPRAPEFVEGVLNLRGTVLPVVDQRRRFRLPPAKNSEQRRIVVINLDGHRTGFIVDSVAEVRKVAESSIEPAPALSPEQAALVRRVANLEREKRIILLLEATRLLEGHEHQALTEVAEV